MADLTLAAAAGTGVAERRRTRRLRVRGLLSGLVVDSGAPMDVRDLSFGGFVAEVGGVLEAGVTYDIRFLPPIGEDVVFKARAVHCCRVSPDGRPVRYLGGFEFNHADAGSRPGVTRLMGHLAEALGFGDGQDPPQPA